MRISSSTVSLTTLPIREEPCGERLLLVTDPNGIVYELVEWVQPTVTGAR